MRLLHNSLMSSRKEYKWVAIAYPPTSVQHHFGKEVILSTCDEWFSTKLLCIDDLRGNYKRLDIPDSWGSIQFFIYSRKIWNESGQTTS